KATRTLLVRIRDSSSRRRSLTAASSRSLSRSQLPSHLRRCAKLRRQAPCWSNCWSKERLTVCASEVVSKYIRSRPPRSAIQTPLCHRSAPSGLLANGAEEGGSLALAQDAHGSTTDATRLARPAVDHGFELEVAALPVHAR